MNTNHDSGTADTRGGKVSLVSAGPGDLELLTIKAARTLATADVLMLDDLVDPQIVSLAPRARVIRVGKRGGCRSTPQAFICRLMRRYAQRGEHVVRVKGGDALLFGRAGEEIGFLRKSGIEVVIVNGISSGFAAAAALGVSLTHRDHCRGVTFVTAHAQDHSEPDWAALAATGTTLAIYMGMAQRRVAAAVASAHSRRGGAGGQPAGRGAPADDPGSTGCRCSPRWFGQSGRDPDWSGVGRSGGSCAATFAFAGRGVWLIR
jgi:uroporphyrin-III C-methyltransferase